MCVKERAVREGLGTAYRSGWVHVCACACVCVSHLHTVPLGQSKHFGWPVSGWYFPTQGVQNTDTQIDTR